MSNRRKIKGSPAAAPGSDNTAEVYRAFEAIGTLGFDAARRLLQKPDDEYQKGYAAGVAEALKLTEAALGMVQAEGRRLQQGRGREANGL